MYSLLTVQLAPVFSTPVEDTTPTPPAPAEPNPHQLFGIELKEVMQRQEKELGCPDLVVPRFVFEVVKQLEQTGLPHMHLSSHLR